MADKYFNKEYVEYWKGRVGNALDGTKVPDEEVISFFVNKLLIKKDNAVLDLGCGFGRLYPFLSKETKEVTGIEVNEESLAEAAKYHYKKLVQGTAEKTNLPDAFFDRVVAWEVYDVVEQREGLIEENRLMKEGGLFLVTGKNNEYYKDDKPAFIAERNAKLKNFPNHFTDVYGLMEKSEGLGFEVVDAYGFARRGDFGEMKFFDILKSKERQQFYQFMLILKKKGEPRETNFEVCYEYSNTARELAKENKFEDMKEFFKWHKEKYGENY